MNISIVTTSHIHDSQKGYIRNWQKDTSAILKKDISAILQKDTSSHQPSRALQRCTPHRDKAFFSNNKQLFFVIILSLSYHRDKPHVFVHNYIFLFIITRFLYNCTILPLPMLLPPRLLNYYTAVVSRGFALFIDIQAIYRLKHVCQL